MGKKTGGKPLPRGITKRETGDGTTLYIGFVFKGVRCREPLSGWLDEPSAIKAAENLRGEILNKITNLTFKYADYFPKSKKCALFGGGVSNANLSTYLDKVVANAKAKGIKKSSIETYTIRARDLKTRLGNRIVSDFNESDIRDLTLELSKTQKYASVESTLKVLRSALHEAHIEKVVSYNPFELFKLTKYMKRPSKKEVESKVRPFNHTELTQLTAACQTEEENILVKLWAKCGFRNGELMALRWQDVDLDEGVVSVTLNYVTQIKETGTPKTEDSERDILLDTEGLALFVELKGRAKDEGGLVFRNPRSKHEGLQWDNYALRRLFVRLFKITGVTTRKIYNMRHTYATIRISMGHNLWDISQQMGHSSPDMLYKTYGDFIQEYQDLLTKNGPKRPTDVTGKNETTLFH